MPPSVMPLIRIREKNQITLPREVMDVLHVQAPAHVEYKILPDGVLIRPIGQIPSDDRLSKIRRLSKSNRGVYKTAEEVDSFIHQLRNE